MHALSNNLKSLKLALYPYTYRLKAVCRGLTVLPNRRIFGIGMIKTGTTSLAAALSEMGFVVAPQRPGEELLDDWIKRDFHKIRRISRFYGEAFQDVPFCLPHTFQYLDQSFSDSRFILTVRDSPEKWYDSFVRFHSVRLGNEEVPSKDDIQANTYVYPGWAWKYQKAVFGIQDTDPYNKSKLIETYESHIDNVTRYFRDQPDKLLTLNVGEAGAYQRLATFLGVKTAKEDFPWENKTADHINKKGGDKSSKTNSD